MLPSPVRVLASCLALLSCAPAESPGAHAARDRAAARAESLAHTSAVSAPASLSVRLESPEEVRAGDVVRLTLRVTNTGRRAVDLYLRGREPTVDVIVTRSNGDTAWRRLADAVIPAIVQLRALAPGESVVVPLTWDQRAGDGRAVGEGAYAIRAALLTEDAPGLVSEPVALRIR